MENKCFGANKETKDVLLNTQSIENIVSKYQSSKQSNIKNVKSTLEKAEINKNEKIKVGKIIINICIIWLS